MLNDLCRHLDEKTLFTDGISTIEDNNEEFFTDNEEENYLKKTQAISMALENELKRINTKTEIRKDREIEKITGIRFNNEKEILDFHKEWIEKFINRDITLEQYYQVYEALFKDGIITNTWENSDCWETGDGTRIKITDLDNNHLASIPRYLYRQGLAPNKKYLPPQIVKEIKRRGFKLLDNCVVFQH